MGEGFKISGYGLESPIFITGPDALKVAHTIIAQLEGRDDERIELCPISDSELLMRGIVLGLITVSPDFDDPDNHLSGNTSWVWVTILGGSRRVLGVERRDGLPVLDRGSRGELEFLIIHGERES